MAYSYDDFERAANAAGLMGNFSQYDLDLAREHPEFGMSILSLKQDYNNATTDEQRLLANEAANALRTSYGNYTGGSDGSKYISTGLYDTKIDDTLGRIGSFGSFSYDDAPTYTNRYEPTQKQLLDSILDRGAFSWSKEDDPQWSSYKKQYLREGERATADALAKASAASGGRPSSFAVNAATQAGDYYAAKLSDIIPTLYQQAYDRYLDEYSMKLSDLNAVNTQEQMDYAKYLDSLSQYNADRQQAYNEYLNDFNMLQSYLGDLQGQSETERASAQQKLANALTLFEMTGYVPEQYAGTLGLPAGTPNAEQAYNDWYMLQKAAGTSGGTSGGKSGGTGEAAGSASDAITKFKAGDHSDAVIRELLAEGYTQSQIEAAGYTGSYFKADHGIQNALLEEINRDAEGGMSPENLYNKIVRWVNSGKITEEQGDWIAESFGYV